LNQTDKEMTLSLKTPDLNLHSPDPTIINAAIGAGSAIFGSLLTVVLTLIKAKSGKRVVIVMKNGAKIEVPADISIETLDILIDRARVLDQESARLVIE
jgi:hypothetical protein